MAAWKLFGHATTAEQLPAELRSILAQMQRERVAFETLTNAARESGQHLTQLAQPISDAQKVVSELQARVKALERLVPVLATLDEQTEAVSRVQRRTETQLTHTSEDAKRLRTEIDELHATFEQALALKNDLAGFLELGGGFKALRMDADKLTAEVRDVTQGFDRVRERQEELRRTGEAVATRPQGFEAKVNELKALHGDVLERSEQISGRHDEVQQADEELRARLATLRDEVQRTVQRFELENQGLDAVSQRILGLRGGLTDMETRFRSLEESSRTITDVRSKADGLATQLSAITESMAELEAQAERVRAVEANAGRLGETVEGMTQQVARLEKAKPAVEAALQDVASLRGTHEAVKGAIEEVQAAASEIARVRDSHAATKAWLASATDSVNALRGELAAVEEMKPTVEVVRAEADRLSQSMAQIEARRQLVENLNTRLSELASLGGQLEERSRGLLDRMEGADERFKTLAAHAEEAGRIEQLVPAAIATLEGAERRVADVGAAVSSLEARAQNLEGLAERTRALGQELELRQGALDKASEHLGAASQLREQAAAGVQQLEERTGQLTGALATAGARLTELTATLDELDSRAGGLRFAQKRMAQFEERLAKWEAVESHLNRALEQ